MLKLGLMTVVDAHTCPMLVTLPNTQCETVSCLSPPYLGFRPDKSLLCPAENLLLLEGTSTPLGCVKLNRSSAVSQTVRGLVLVKLVAKISLTHHLPVLPQIPGSKKLARMLIAMHMTT